MASTTRSVKAGPETQEWVAPDLPSDIPLFAAGLGLLLTPKWRAA